MTRQRKTPAQRAQEAYDAACRAAERIETKLTDSRAETAQLEAEHADAVKRRDYLAQHPDLPPLSRLAPVPGEESVTTEGKPSPGIAVEKALNNISRKAKTR